MAFIGYVIMRTTVFGDFDESLCNDLDQFSITINSENVDLNWNQCNLLADFLAGYYACFFPDGSHGSDTGAIDRKNMTHSINFIMNEFVENAVKFRSTGDIIVKSGLFDKEIVFLIKNTISYDGVEEFHSLLNEITTGDPGELLIAKIEQNVMEGNDNASGLGFLTIMNDYEAVLGWKFEPCTDNYDNNILLSNMVRLKTRKDV